MEFTFLAGILTGGMVFSAHAATIKYEGNAKGLNAISVTGEIENGDADRFKVIVSEIRAR